jgi:hypothetical protein
MSTRDTRSNEEALIGLLGIEDQIRKGLEASGVQSGAAPGVRPGAAPSVEAPSIASLPGLAMPTTWQQDAYKDSPGKYLGKQAINTVTGGFLEQVLFPESAGGKARYASDMKTYQKHKDIMSMSGMADPFREMLQNETTDDDLKALENLAVLYPEVYGGVLKKYQTNRLAPDAVTYTEGKWQLDPNYDNGEGQEKGRYYLERQGNDGSDKKVYGEQGFVPARFQPGAEYLDRSVGKAQEQAYVHQGNAQGARNVLDQMELVGPDNWTAGYAAKGGEFIKSVFGREDFVTGIRKEYQDIKVRNAISNLPPGVASDKDIELALSPWPEDTSNYALIVKKLEAIERIENARYEYRTFEGSYIESNRGRNGLQSSWNDTATAKRVAEDNERDTRAVSNQDVESILQELGVK